MQSVQQFQHELQSADADYIIDDRLSDELCVLRFLGHFEGHPVVWQARVETLRHYARHHDLYRLRQFIEIDVDEDGYRVQVGLNVSVIDKATLMGTIIMIRKYKRLQRGRHQYGESIEV